VIVLPLLSDNALITLVAMLSDKGILTISLVCSLNRYGQTKLLPIQSDTVLF